MKRRDFLGVVGMAMAAMPWMQKGTIAPDPGIFIEHDGKLEINPNPAQELHVRTFVADEVRHPVGHELWSVGAALTLGEFVTPEINGLEALWCKNASGPFQEGDYLQIRHLDLDADPLAVTKAWFRIVDVSMDGSPYGYYAWIVEHIAGGKPGATIKDGAAIINFGPVPDAPFMRIGEIV